VHAKIPKHAQAEVKADYWAVFDVPDTVAPGLDAVRYVQARLDSFARHWRDSYPAAVKCLLADRDSLTVYLRCPREHWTRVRHSTSSKGPSARPAVGSRSSAGSPASTAACPWSGPCSTAPAEAGAGSP
jgi:hypothetical protein